MHFKRRFGAPSPAVVLRFVGAVGFAAAIAGLPVAFAAARWGGEVPPARWTETDFLVVAGGGLLDVVDRPSGNCSSRWPMVLATAFQSKRCQDYPIFVSSSSCRRPQVYNVSIALGLAAASPAFVALGTILAIPGNVVVDAALGGARLTTLQGVGAVVVVSAFVLLAREPPRRDDVALDSASSNPLFEGGAVA